MFIPDEINIEQALEMHVSEGHGRVGVDHVAATKVGQNFKDI